MGVTDWAETGKIVLMVFLFGVLVWFVWPRRGEW